jgi:signal transduction histidine kinase
MVYLRCARYLLICLFWALAAPSSAAVVLPQLSGLAVLEDKTGTESIQGIAAASNFKPLPGGTFAAGYTRSVHWLRFKVTAPAGEWWLDILPPYLDDLRLYEADPAHPGNFIERRAGAVLPFAAREVDYRSFVFKLHHADATPRTYYLRLATNSSSLILLRLWPPESFFVRSSLELGLLMAVLAIFLTALLFNINNWFWLRDRLTLWFIAYLASLTVNFAGISGLMQQFLAPEWPAVNVLMVRVGAFCAMAFGTAFYRRLFMIERSQGFLFWLYEAGFWLLLLAMVSLPLGYFTQAMSLSMNLMLLMTLIGTWLATRLWRRKVVGSGMMFMANLITMTGVGLAILNLMGVITGGFFLLHSLQIATLGTVLALQLALGMRLSSERDERLQALDSARQSESVAQSERESSTRKGQLLTMLSHELRNGLSVLRMAISFQPMPRNTIVVAERAIQGLSDVIERSLQTEKLADGEIRLERLPCDVASLVEAVAANSQDPSRIVIDLAARPTIDTDPKLLNVILTNLIENALKYGAKNAPVQVALVIDNAPRPNITLSVSNAIGRVGRPDPARLFEKYYRAPQTQGHTGSGVGLHLSKALARLLGGELRYLAEAETVVFQLRL